MSLLGKYDLFIFDWDGTLSTSTLLVRLSRFLRPGYNIDYAVSHISKYTPGSLNMKYLMHEEKGSAAYARFYDFYSILFSPKLKADTLEMLKKLKRSGKKIAIFSDSNNYRLMSEMKKLGTISYMDTVIAANSIHRYKPDPTGILMIIKKHRIKKSRCIYIGDMASDILTARLAGISSCCVADGFGRYEELKRGRPSYLFSSLSSLSNALV